MQLIARPLANAIVSDERELEDHPGMVIAEYHADAIIGLMRRDCTPSSEFLAKLVVSQIVPVLGMPTPGSQQESLCLWLTDAFAPQGAYLNPQVTAGPAARTRELCDVLLTSAGHTVLVESKALAVLTRRRLPTRDELHGDVVKHIQKATKQVSGAARYLRMGNRVTGQRGQNVAVDRDKPLHLIVLIPDLTMLSAADNLGRKFLAEQILKHECYFHVLDPTQLLRLVQAATTVARRRPRISEIDALNWCLVKRLERALDHDSSAFDMIFRFDDDPNANPAASDESSS